MSDINSHLKKICENTKDHYGRFSCVFTEKEIAAQTSRVAGQINADYAGKDLVIVCVLKGAFMFFSDLVKLLHVGPELDFVRVSSYAGKTESSRKVTITKDLEVDVHNKHVLLVEDVVDTGHTITFLKKHMQAKGACNVSVATLVNKNERREIEFEADYAAFNVPEGFIVGYGLDYAEKYRELPGIYILDVSSHAPIE